MTAGTDITFWIAFSAGILSFVSPCVLPLIPSYITYITGLSFSQVQDAHPGMKVRLTVLYHSLFFILGFSVVFITLGALAGLASAKFQIHLREGLVWIQRVGGVLIFLFGVRRLVNTDLGLVLQGVKDNDQAIRASGMNITHFKALAVLITAAMGCMGGACLVHIYMWSGISQFALDFSILPIAATVIGGGGTLVGPLIGCLILVPISELLRDFGTLRIVFYSLILVAFIVFRSEGIMVYAQRKYHQFERWTRI